MSTLALPRPGAIAIRRTAAGLTVAALAGLAAFITWAQQGPALSPDLRLAVFPPVLTRVEAFRTIILGNAIPVAQTPVPGVWLIHLEPGQPEEVKGAVVTGIGPFVRLASSACLSGTTPSRSRE